MTRSPGHGKKGFAKFSDKIEHSNKYRPINNYMAKSVANYNQSQYTALVWKQFLYPRIFISGTEMIKCTDLLYIPVNNHSSDTTVGISRWKGVRTHMHAFSQKEVPSRRLCVLLSCVAFANLSFMQVNIFQTLELTLRFIVQVHCKAAKTERVRLWFFKWEFWIRNPTR